MKSKKLSVILTLLFFVGCASNQQKQTQVVDPAAQQAAVAQQQALAEQQKAAAAEKVKAEKVLLEMECKKAPKSCRKFTQTWVVDNGNWIAADKTDFPPKSLVEIKCVDMKGKKTSCPASEAPVAVQPNPAPSQQPAQSQVAQPQGQMQLSEENLAGSGKSLACKVNGIQVQCPPELLQKYTEQQQSGQGFDLNGVLNGGLNVLQKGGQILNTIKYY